MYIYTYKKPLEPVALFRAIVVRLIYGYIMYEVITYPQLFNARVTKSYIDI